MVPGPNDVFALKVTASNTESFRTFGAASATALNSTANLPRLA
jgi:hypothetical protein